MEDWQRAKLAHMQRAQGPEAGTCYIIHEVGAHHIGMLWDRYESAHGQDNEIKQFATRAQSDMQQHLQQAERIADQTVGGRAIVRPVSERERG